MLSDAQKHMQEALIFSFFVVDMILSNQNPPIISLYGISCHFIPSYVCCRGLLFESYALVHLS